jgi:hypothetical protein
VRAGGCILQLRQSRASQYIPAILASSNKGWQRRWFYLWNDGELLPLFSQRVVTAPPMLGATGPCTKDRKTSNPFSRPWRRCGKGDSPPRE